MAPGNVPSAFAGLNQTGPEGRRRDVIRLTVDCSEPGDEILRVAVGDDRGQLAAVGIGDPYDES